MVLKTLSIPNGFQNLVILLILITGIHTPAASSSGLFGKGNSPGYFTHVESLALTATPQPVAPPKLEKLAIGQAAVGSPSAFVSVKPSHPCQIDLSKMGLYNHDIYGIGMSLVPTENGDIYGLTGEIHLYRELWIQKMTESEGTGVKFRFAKHAGTVKVDLQGRYWTPKDGEEHGIPQPCTKEYSDEKKIHAYQKTAFWKGFPFKDNPLFFMVHGLKVKNLTTGETWDVIQDMAKGIKIDQSNGFTVNDLDRSGCAACPHDAFYNRQLNFGLFKARLIPRSLYWQYGIQFDVRQKSNGVWELTSRSEDWHLAPLLLTAGIGATHAVVSEATSLAVNLLTAEGGVARLTDDSSQRPLLLNGSGAGPSRVEEESSLNKGRYGIVQTVFCLGDDDSLVDHFTHTHADFIETRRLWTASFDQIDQLKTPGTVSSNPALRNLQELQILDTSAPEARKDINASRSSILSTGGAWGIDFTRSASGEELRIMLAGLKNIGQEVSGTSHNPDEILRQLANRLFRPSPAVRAEDMGKLIEHQTLAFIMAANYTGEVHLKDEWADALGDEAAKVIAACVNGHRKAVHKFDGEIDAGYVRSNIASLKKRAEIGTEEVLL